MPGQVLYPVSPLHITPPGDMGGGGGSNGGGGILNAIHPAQFNQPNVSTGMDADGNPSFDVTPASIGGGFLNHLIAGRQGQMQVNNINAQLQAAKLEALSKLANTREQGKQERKGHITDAQITMLQGMGLMPRTTPGGDTIDADLINKVASQTDKPSLDAAGAKAQTGNVIAQNNLNTLQSPQGQSALHDSAIGQALMPALNAQRASQVQATPGDTVAYNSAQDLTNPVPDILHGATSSSSSFTPMQVPTRDPKTGKITGFGVQTFPTGQSQTGAGSLQQQLPPDLIQQALQQQPPAPSGVSTGDPDDPANRMGAMSGAPQVGMMPTLGGDSNIPNKPSPTPYSGTGPYAGTTAEQDPYSGLMQMIMQYMGGLANKSPSPAQSPLDSAFSPAY